MSGFTTDGLPTTSAALTGNELIAADTQLPQGENPASYAVTPAQLKGFYRAPVALVSGTVVTENALQSDLFTLTLTTNATLAVPTNLQAGQNWKVEVTQDSVGDRTLAYASAYKWASGTAPTLTTTAGAIDLLSFTYDGTIIIGSSQLNNH